MPGCCAPWPGKRKATRRFRGSWTRVSTRLGSSAPSAAAASAASRQTAMRRWAKDPAAHLERVGDVGQIRPPDGAAGGRRGWRSAASRAAAVAAERSRSWRGREGRLRAAGAPAPPRARRGRWCRRCRTSSPRRGAAPARGPRGEPGVDEEGARRRGRAAGSGRSKCRLGGSCRCSRASTVLISPATPAAASRWPMFPLTEPRAQKPRRPAARRRRGAAPRPRSGRPSGVAVPCAST